MWEVWRLELKGELSRRFITAIIRGVRRRFADTAFFSRDARVRARPFVASPQESQSAPFVLLPRFPPRRPVDCIAASASVASDIPRFFSFASVCAAAEMPFSRARGATTPRRSSPFFFSAAAAAAAPAPEEPAAPEAFEFDPNDV